MSDKASVGRTAVPRGIISGGGFAGATAARTLERRPAGSAGPLDHQPRVQVAHAGNIGGEVLRHFTLRR